MHDVVQVEVDILELFRAYFWQIFVVLIEQSGHVLDFLSTIAVIQTKLEQNVRLEAEKLIVMGCGHGGK